MPKHDNQPCIGTLRTCTQVERYPDVISYWMQPPGQVNRCIRDAPRYDFLAWLKPLPADMSSDEID